LVCDGAVGGHDARRRLVRGFCALVCCSLILNNGCSIHCVLRTCAYESEITCTYVLQRMLQCGVRRTPLKQRLKCNAGSYCDFHVRDGQRWLPILGCLLR
jgi:hypothetical protein